MGRALLKRTWQSASSFLIRPVRSRSVVFVACRRWSVAWGIWRHNTTNLMPSLTSDPLIRCQIQVNNEHLSWIVANINASVYCAALFSRFSKPAQRGWADKGFRVRLRNWFTFSAAVRHTIAYSSHVRLGTTAKQKSLVSYFVT